MMVKPEVRDSRHLPQRLGRLRFLTGSKTSLERVENIGRGAALYRKQEGESKFRPITRVEIEQTLALRWRQREKACRRLLGGRGARHRDPRTKIRVRTQ